MNNELVRFKRKKGEKLTKIKVRPIKSDLVKLVIDLKKSISE